MARELFSARVGRLQQVPDVPGEDGIGCSRPRAERRTAVLRSTGTTRAERPIVQPMAPDDAVTDDGHMSEDTRDTIQRDAVNRERFALRS